MNRLLPEVRRVRRDTRMRRVDVCRVTRVSPHIVSVTFTGPELADFASDGFDDHVKFVVPTPGQALVLPVPTPDGPRMPDGLPRPPMRDYTPRRFDAAALELDIEFALHGDGLAATWAAQAAPGQQAGIGGPRGSFIVPTDFDTHLLVGDETALPAIARRLEELPAGVRAVVVLAVDPADRRPLPSRADVTLHWVAPDALVDTVRALPRPDGLTYGWGGGEARAIGAVRQAMVEQLGVDPAYCRCAAYWKQGAVAHHESLG